MHVRDGAVVRLTRMEKGGHVLGDTGRLLRAEDRRHELADERCELLLVDHVVPDDQIGVALLAHLDVVENLGHVRLADHFVAREDQRQLEVRHSLLHLVDDALDHGELVEERHVVLLLDEVGPVRIAVLLVQAARGVPQFDNKDILLNACINARPQQLLKKGPVLGQTCYPRELMLEEAPNIVRLEADLLGSRQQDLTLEYLIVLFRIAVERAHLLALDVPVLHVRPILEDLEETLPLVVISDGVVSQLNVDINVRRCGCMDMVQTALGHLVKKLI